MIGARETVMDCCLWWWCWTVIKIENGFRLSVWNESVHRLTASDCVYSTTHLVCYCSQWRWRSQCAKDL